MEGLSHIPRHEAEHEIAVRHLEQLSRFSDKEPPSHTPEGDELPYGAFGSQYPYDDLVNWSKDNSTQIEAAVNNRAFAELEEPESKSSGIQWVNAYLGLIQSGAMYLRDEEKVAKAVEAYKKEDFELALRLLKASTAQIEEIADLWHMDFQLLCDLSNASGAWLRNGPYCGAYIGQDSGKPFVVITFRGTNNVKDILTDVDIRLESSGHNFLYNTHVSRGVFKGMFLDFNEGQAFKLICEGLEKLIRSLPIDNLTENPVLTHVAGHSLGGSYASLCYTQFTIPNNLPQVAKLGNLYTFGSPRVGGTEFARALLSSRGNHERYSYRFVNDDDLVPQVPPVDFLLVEREKFNHVDVGYSISSSHPPQKLGSEIGKYPSGLSLRMLFNNLTITPHYLTSYRKSFQATVDAFAG